MPQANGRSGPRAPRQTKAQQTSKQYRETDWPELCLPRASKKPRKPKQKKRFHRAFRLLIALGLVPTKSRQGDPLGLRLNRMHVMDGDCEKTAECLAAEGAPELGLKDKHGAENGTPECQDAALKDSKSITASENGTVNGDHSKENGIEETEAKDEPLRDHMDSKDDVDSSDEPARSPEVNKDEPLGTEIEVGQQEKDQQEDAGHLDDDEKNCKVETSVVDLSEKVKTDETVSEVKTSDTTIKNENSESEKEAESTNQETVTKEEVAAASEEEDRNSVSSSHISQSEIERRKRSIERDGEAEISSGSESEGGRKRPKREPDTVTPEPSQESQGGMEDDRERVIRDYVDGCSQNMDDMTMTVDKLQKELSALAELARAKELEWNSILRLRKLKEEMLERLLRKRRVALVFHEGLPPADWNHDSFNQRSNTKCQSGNNQLMMVPIVSSSPGGGGGGIGGRGMNSVPPVRIPEIGRQQRPILPKPYPHMIDPNNIVREGRNGPILDVKSIIADYSSHYRSRHPENVPRRGRRVRGEGPPVSRVSSSPALISMANMALGSGASVRTDPTYSMAQEHLRTTTTDHSPRTSHQGDGNSGMSFKDVLVQFAKLSQTPAPGKPPPPYPEVTLHPVTSPQSPPTSHSSLLHGILTKSSPLPAPAHHRPATFSPTLARLLTAPERPSPSTHQVSSPQMTPTFRPPSSRVSITDILTSTKKTRNEITITPVAGNRGTKSKDEVVLLDDDDETGSGDRLVIDEGGEGVGGSEEVPQCQGCRQKSAQFVCAGCGNQWYCSRECQVTAWEEHSDVCSG